MRKSKKISEAMYYLGAEVRRSRRDPDYAELNTTVEAWIKATSEDQAREFSIQQLLSDGWRVTKIHVLAKVDPGFARIGSMMDPPAFTEEEADEWTEHYEVAESEGYTFAFSHYHKNGSTRIQQEKKAYGQG